MPENTSSPSQKGRIFISYRRIDTSYAAGRIYDRLVAHFGEDAIFMDVDTIEGGTDFIKVLEDAVQSCDVLIALIGKQWLTIKDKDGKPRLDNPEDFVRIEIATALNRSIRVIPVLVDGVGMPQPTELPENLKALARRNALQVNHHSFNPDIYRLIEHTKSALDEAEKSRVMKAQALQVEREKAAKDAIEKAQLEAEELARQKAIKEKAAREAVEKAKRENAKRQAARKAAVREALLKMLPFLRTLGIIGIIIFLLWGGSLAIPQFIALIPTPKATLTPTKNVIATTESTSLPTKITDSRGVSMMLVSAGEFIMGSNNTSTDEKPMQHVFLDTFYIDKNEVTNALYKACVTSGGCSPPRQIGSRTRTHYYDNPMFDNYPVVYFDWNQADTYCKWRGGKLPTESQWEKAARGTDGFIYPWGNEFDGGPANFCDRNCTFDIANMDFNDGYNDTAPVSNYRGGKSVYDVYDLAGNVWEWVRDWYSETYYQYLPLSNPFNDHESQYRVVRGGGWNNILDDLRGSNRYKSSPNDFYYYLGFRCAKDTP